MYTYEYEIKYLFIVIKNNLHIFKMKEYFTLMEA